MTENRNKLFGFDKSEKLCSKIIIEKLYSSQKRELFFPLSLHWMSIESDDSQPAVKVLVVAPKRKLHHAVDRNRTKRIIRECYRLHKKPLIDSLTEKNLHIALSLNYIHTRTPNFHKLEAIMVKIIDHLVKETSSHD